MAEETKDAAAAPAGAPKSALLLPLINTLLILGVLGLLVYTRLVFKRPAITESGERERLAKLQAAPTPPPQAGMVTFEPVTVNIGVAGIPPAAAGGGQPAVDPAPAPGKLHYATVGFALELRDAAQKPRFEALRPILLDRILQILGHKSLTELNTVQGRYILRSQLMDVANQMIPGPQAAVTNVYFTQFVVQ